MQPRLLAHSFAIAALVSAGSVGPGPAAAQTQMMRPCVHSYRSGVVAVVAAQSAGTARAVPAVTLSGIKVDGQPADVATMSGLQNAVVAGSGVVCTLPCSLGTQEGRWEFTATAAGHVPRAASVDARYAVFQGGCPSYNDKGTEVRLTLEPVPTR
jgi:hypothetical protein